MVSPWGMRSTKLKPSHAALSQITMTVESAKQSIPSYNWQFPNEMIDSSVPGPMPPSQGSFEACRAVARAVSEVPADRFLHEVLGPGLGGSRGSWESEKFAAALDDPANCLRLIYSRYSFSRRGKDRKALAEVAAAALDLALTDGCLADISL